MYSSVRFSHVTNSEGARLTASLANARAHPNLDLDRKKSVWVCMSVYECGVFLVADVKIWMAFTSSSGLVVSGFYREGRGEEGSLIPT